MSTEKTIYGAWDIKEGQVTHQFNTTADALELINRINGEQPEGAEDIYSLVDQTVTVHSSAWRSTKMDSLPLVDRLSQTAKDLTAGSRLEQWHINAVLTARDALEVRDPDLVSEISYTLQVYTKIGALEGWINKGAISPFRADVETLMARTKADTNAPAKMRVAYRRHGGSSWEEVIG